MKLYTFDVIDSTSTQAVRLLERDEPVPFAVQGLTQTQGRGRHGSVWNSATGGLYVSLVQRVTSAEMSLAPLQAAALVATWIREVSGVYVAIKWPNDLLIAGRKICGILCESSGNGNVIVGIGVNVEHAPANTSYAAGALRDFCNTLPAIPKLGENLCWYWETEWPRMTHDRTLRIFSEHQTPLTRFYIHRHSSLIAESPGLSPEGFLRLQGETIVSATHEWMCCALNLCGLDIGPIYVGSQTDHGLVDIARLPTTFSNERQITTVSQDNFVQANFSDSPLPVFLASSAPLPPWCRPLGSNGPIPLEQCILRLQGAYQGR